MLAANLAADLAAWCRLLGLYDCDDLKDAEPDTLRYRLWSLPTRLVRHARQRILKLSFRVLQPLPVPALTDRTSNDAAGFASCYGPHRRSPLQGF